MLMDADGTQLAQLTDRYASEPAWWHPRSPSHFAVLQARRIDDQHIAWRQRDSHGELLLHVHAIAIDSPIARHAHGLGAYDGAPALFVRHIRVSDKHNHWSSRRREKTKRCGLSELPIRKVCGARSLRSASNLWQIPERMAPRSVSILGAAPVICPEAE